MFFKNINSFSIFIKEFEVFFYKKIRNFFYLNFFFFFDFDFINIINKIVFSSLQLRSYVLDFSHFFLFLPEFILVFFSFFILILIIIYRQNSNIGFLNINLIDFIYLLLFLFFNIIISLIIYIYFNNALWINNQIIFNGFFIINSFITFSKIFLLFLMLIFLLTTYKFIILLSVDFDCIELFYFLIIFLFLIFIFISTNNLCIFYIIGLSFSLITYTLLILPFNNLSIESTIKYFFIGALSFSFFLFSSSLIFGIVGSFDLIIITYNFDYMNIFFENNNILFKISFLFLLFFFLLKLGMFPGHFFLLDVYEGTINITVFLLFTIVKFVFFFLSIRILIILFFENYNFWFILILLISLISLLIGTFGAIFEKKIIRFLAYTSITNMSFVFISWLNNNFLTIIFKSTNYMLTYSIMLTIFFIIYFKIFIFFSRKPLIFLIELNILQHYNYFLAFLFTIIIWAMAGLPPFAGFYIKLFILENLILENQIELVIFFLCCSTLNVFSYIRILKIIWYDNNKIKNDFIISSSQFIKKNLNNIFDKILNIILYILIFFIVTYILWIDNIFSVLINYSLILK